MRIGDSAVIDSAGLDALIRLLGALGYDTMGPVVRDRRDSAGKGDRRGRSPCRLSRRAGSGSLPGHSER